MITITETAKEKIKALLQSEDKKDKAVRVGIQGRGPGGFMYDLRFAGEDEKGPDDILIETGGFKVLIDGPSASKLKGATLDFVDNFQGSGFKVDNPNPLWDDPRALAVQSVIDNSINPGVASHGGFVSLLDVKGETAYIALGGGCQGCGMADVTLKQGIEVMIKEAVPEIQRIIDTTDHAGGNNPYYQPAKGGESPLA